MVFQGYRHVGPKSGFKGMKDREQLRVFSHFAVGCLP
jgi:hypothetical protein